MNVAPPRKGSSALLSRNPFIFPELALEAAPLQARDNGDEQSQFVLLKKEVKRSKTAIPEPKPGENDGPLLVTTILNVRVDTPAVNSVIGPKTVLEMLRSSLVVTKIVALAVPDPDCRGATTVAVTKLTQLIPPAVALITPSSTQVTG